MNPSVQRETESAAQQSLPNGVTDNTKTKGVINAHPPGPPDLLRTLGLTHRGRPVRLPTLMAPDPGPELAPDGRCYGLLHKDLAEW